MALPLERATGDLRVPACGPQGDQGRGQGRCRCAVNHGKKKKLDVEADAERALEEKAAAEKLRVEQIVKARDDTLKILADLRGRGALSDIVYTELVGEKLAKELAKEGSTDTKTAATAKMEVDDDATTPQLTTLYERLKTAHARGAISTATLMSSYAAKPALPPAVLMPKTADGSPGESKLEECFTEPDLATEILENPARVLRPQERVIAPLPGSRYVPVSGRRAGIIVLKDTTPDMEEDLLSTTALSARSADQADEEEPEPPAPFEFLG